MHPFQILLQRTILALVLLQLACANPPVHARHALHHVARHPQPWSWFPFRSRARADDPGPPPPPPAAQPAPASPPTQQAPPPAPAPAPSSPSNTSPPANPSSNQSPVNSTAVPRTNAATAGCSTIRVRREWRKLSRDEQTAYITAVKCLADLPSKLLPGGDYRRYDDFENVHSRMRSKIHWIAAFLPWHRQFMFYYEQALRNECGYSGNLPRWDWTLDSADMSQSPVWSSDPDVGFGGNGRDFSDVDDGLDGSVVTDGAFANWPLYYPEYHELQRSYNLPSQYKQAGRSYGSQFFDPPSIKRVQSQTSYAKFALALEGTDPSSTGPSNPGPHSIIHVIIGGDISPTAYAANEVRCLIKADTSLHLRLFYLHHTNVDFHWWQWQNNQRSNRLMAYGGPATRGSTRNDAKLTDNLKFLGLGPDVRVQDTMDTYAAPYCYRYE
ncbi:hypothetical protein PtA15_18A379 [Puccinia triticina]|uniref:Tyrosinase copper-binding domain-containing protein n=1 Tax=Puccinia triticina TaxID=208348 RepID=A0ABY7D6Q9_9BASI|nr:uncharacterized protein PtA15_18A379 [Puccinia triticina]WAQ93319.1 hypothetical protein PtA15_18A379 [Puccinia triticina]WAR63308.1 hypothetical protein PtB15_18B391 [Puccinia triticina]